MKASQAAARIVPRSLAGRVLLIIFAGLVVAHAASFALLAVERERTVDRYAAAELAARISDYLRSGTAPATRGFGPRQRLRWQDVDSLGIAPAGASEPSAVFAGELRRLLTESLGADPVAWISIRTARRSDWPAPAFAHREPERPPSEGFRGGPGAGDRVPKLVTVALDLPSGHKAIAESTVFQASVQVPADAWIAIALIFGVTALFSILAVRLAMQPVRMLASAADRLSRNIAEPPLPEHGAVEIRAAARAFNRMQDRLRRHVNSRALAFAAMSHDIRTPLTRMRLRLESLGPEARDKLAGDLDEIETLAKTVLEVTRGLAPEEPMARIDVGGLVERVARDNAAVGHRVAFRGAAAPIEARPLALRRVLGNLVDNAFKYGSDVEIQIEDSPEALRLHVCDRGPGIPEEHLQKVTHPFYRVEGSRNRGTGGAGLGLAIAKDIAEGLGGELVLANRDAGGLRATIVLPR